MLIGSGEIKIIHDNVDTICTPPLQCNCVTLIVYSFWRNNNKIMKTNQKIRGVIIKLLC